MFTAYHGNSRYTHQMRLSWEDRETGIGEVKRVGGKKVKQDKKRKHQNCMK